MIEKATEVAKSVIENLKDQPMILGWLVLNVIFIGMVIWILQIISARNERVDAQREIIIRELQKTCEACRLRQP